jgi:hypothetical protein
MRNEGLNSASRAPWDAWSACVKRLRFKVRWWRWFFAAPSRIQFGFKPESSTNWFIAHDRWMEKEPQWIPNTRTTPPNPQTSSIQP